MDFENAKSFLSQEIEGQSIYDHLSGIIKKIIEEKPDNALDLFENISLQVKQDRTQAATHDFPVIPDNQDERQELLETINRTLEFYGKKMAKPKKKVGDGDGDEVDDIDEDEEENTEENDESELDLNKVANILENLQILQWAGIEFTNQTEIYELQQSIIKFIKKKGETIDNSRFFGKIEGIYNDYWILECKLSEYPEAPENKPEKQENPGNGCNEFVYFVTNDLISGNWEQLPDATPEQLKQSRNVYRLFTGTLDAKVLGQTYFNGLERDLLRCQIARIVASTVLCPASYYNLPEEEDEENPLLIELNEEFEGIEEPNSLESWVHQRGHLRLEGRYLKFKSGNDEEDEEEDNGDGDGDKPKLEPSLEDLEEQMPILQPIVNDTSKSLKPVFERAPKKAPNATGDEDEDGGADDGGDGDEDEEDGQDANLLNVWHIREINSNSSYSVVNLINKLWNGAYCLHIKNSKRFFNVYVGNGVKYSANYYTPESPNVIIGPFSEMVKVENENEDGADGADGNGDENNDEEVDGNGNGDGVKDKVQYVSIFDTIQSEVEPPPPPPPDAENAGTEEQENEDE